jgi:hypothetical protein
VGQVLRLVDWLMELPAELESSYERELSQLEEERRMPYVTTFERHGMLDIIETQLQAKFGAEGVALMPGIREFKDAEEYRAVARTLLTATTLDEVRQACVEVAAPQPEAAGKRKARRGSKTKP